jgi:hypothetical protein
MECLIKPFQFSPIYDDVTEGLNIQSYSQPYPQDFWGCFTLFAFLMRGSLRFALYVFQGEASFAFGIAAF